MQIKALLLLALVLFAAYGTAADRDNERGDKRGRGDKGRDEKHDKDDNKGRCQGKCVAIGWHTLARTGLQYGSGIWGATKAQE